MRGPQISYARLRDESWGIRVASHHPFSPGEEVVVRKADGTTKREILGNIVDRDRGAFPAPATYYRIQRGSRRSTPRRPTHGTAQVAYDLRNGGVHREASLCAAARRAADAIRAYDPSNYEWFDGETEIREAHEARLLTARDEAVEKLRAAWKATTDATRRKRIEMAAVAAKDARIA